MYAQQSKWGNSTVNTKTQRFPLNYLVQSLFHKKCRKVSESPLPSDPQQMDFQGESNRNRLHVPTEGGLLSTISSSSECKNFTHKCIKGSVALNIKGSNPCAWREGNFFWVSESLWIFQGPTSLTLGRNATFNSMRLIWRIPPVHEE